MTNGAGKLDQRKASDDIVAVSARLDRTVPMNTVICCAKRNPLTLTVHFSATGEQYARTLYIYVTTTVNPYAPLKPPSSLSRNDSASGLAAPQPWLEQPDLRPMSDRSLCVQIFDTLHKHALMCNENLETIEATKHQISREPDTRLVRSMPYRQGPAMQEHTKTELDKTLAVGATEPTTSACASLYISVSV